MTRWTGIGRWLGPLLLGVSAATIAVDASGQDPSSKWAQAAKSRPDDPQAALSHGAALRKLGRFDDASKELTRGILLPAARKNGTLPALLDELSHTRLEKGNLTGAFDACDKIGALKGTTAVKATCRARAHLSRNRATEAWPEIARALSVEPNHYKAMVLKARVLSFQQKVVEARELLLRAAGLEPDRPEAFHQLGLMERDAGRMSKAVENLKKAKALDAADPMIVLHLGEVLGVSEEAQRAFARAAALRPSMASAHAGQARVAAARGALKVAETAATEAIRLDPKLFEAHLALGHVRLAQKKWAEALASGTAALKLIPNRSSAELLMADAHAGAGDIDLAVEAYQKAFGLDRSKPVPLIRASAACRAAGRLTTARGFADRAVGDFPKSGPAWAELGDVHRAGGEPARAKEAYRKALSLGGVDASAIQKRMP